MAYLHDESLFLLRVSVVSVLSEEKVAAQHPDELFEAELRRYARWRLGCAAEE